MSTPAVNEDAVVEEEYNVWKRNSPFLYDLVMTHALQWPSLTVQWMPEVTPGKDGAEDIHRLLIGTHTTSSGEGEENLEQNYLMVAETKLPSPETELVAKAYDDGDGDVGGFGATPEKIRIVTKIAHDGEVNKARYMPQNPSLIATKSPTANVYVFDTTKHTDVNASAEFNPQLTCEGHSAEGFGLSWSPHTAGMLLSGSDDHVVCLWDTNTTKKTIAPQLKLTGHTDVVEDVAWHQTLAHMFGSCGDDGTVKLWDSRSNQTKKALHTVKDAHGAGIDVNCLAFNPKDENLFVSGGADGCIQLWDIRKLTASIHKLERHGAGVVSVGWMNDSTLGSAGKDRRIMIWYGEAKIE